MDGWDNVGDSCFKLFLNDPRLVWQDARDACANLDGTPATPYLAVPNDDVELEYMRNLELSNAFWVGVNDIQSKGTFVDVNTGSEMLFNGI